MKTFMKIVLQDQMGLIGISRVLESAMNGIVDIEQCSVLNNLIKHEALSATDIDKEKLALEVYLSITDTEFLNSCTDDQKNAIIESCNCILSDIYILNIQSILDFSAALKCCKECRDDDSIDFQNVKNAIANISGDISQYICKRLLLQLIMGSNLWRTHSQFVHELSQYLIDTDRYIVECAESVPYNRGFCER